MTDTPRQIETRGELEKVWAAVLACSMGLHFISLAAGSQWLHWLTKPVPMPCLIALMLTWIPKREFYRDALIAGFVFSMFGDIFLMLPGDWFVHGLASFLVGHLCYVAAFSSGGAPLKPARILPFLAYGAATMAILFPKLPADLKIPVVVYVGVILAMGWRAAARVGMPGERRRAHWIGLAGAASFIVSDSLIAFDKFYVEGGIPARSYLVMATYWAGQIGIALSVRRKEVAEGGVVAG